MTTTATATRTPASARLGPGLLLATACGTAIASVSVLGLFQIERLVGGVWSLAAVAVAAALCVPVARAFARMCGVVPSGAGLLAYLARGLGRPAAMLVAVPYLLLTVFLVGVEALMVGTMIARLVPAVPPLLGAVALVAVTWAVARAGLSIGYRTQAIATWLLVAGMAGLSIALVARHLLAAPWEAAGAAGPGATAAGLLFPPAPSAARFAAAVGQALFLFMGFELVTTQVEVARSPRAVSWALGASVGVLAGFYGLVSLGFSALPVGAGHDPLVPQLEVARAAGGAPAAVLCVVLCGLASFTSLNGALLALSRFTYALAAQGVLPRALAAMEGRRLVPARALALLAATAIASTLVVAAGGLATPAILAAAATAAVAYAGALLARQRAPFAEAGRPRARRAWGVGLAALLVALGVAVLATAGAQRGAAVGLAAAAAGVGLALARRTLPAAAKATATAAPQAAAAAAAPATASTEARHAS